MATQHATRVTGHVQERQLKSGPVFYLKTRVPGRDPEQTTTRLGPAHNGKGRPLPGTFTRKMAEEALAEFLTDARRGTLELTRQKSGVTFADAAAEYLRFVRDVRKIDETTLKGYVGVIDGYLLERFGDRPVNTITADDVDAYKEHLLAEGRLSNRTIVRHLVVLNSIFKRAKRKGWVKDNPAAAEMVERPPVVYTGEYDAYTRDELELLAVHAKNAQDAAIIRTAAYTGLRQGELLALRWREVDFVTGLVHVRRNYSDRRLKIPKGQEGRLGPDGAGCRRLPRSAQGPRALHRR